MRGEKRNARGGGSYACCVLCGLIEIEVDFEAHRVNDANMRKDWIVTEVVVAVLNPIWGVKVLLPEEKASSGGGEYGTQ